LAAVDDAVVLVAGGAEHGRAVPLMLPSRISPSKK
jgi:hypothetical protein